MRGESAPEPASAGGLFCHLPLSLFVLLSRARRPARSLVSESAVAAFAVVFGILGRPRPVVVTGSARRRKTHHKIILERLGVTSKISCKLAGIPWLAEVV